MEEGMEVSYNQDKIAQEDHLLTSVFITTVFLSLSLSDTIFVIIASLFLSHTHHLRHYCKSLSLAHTISVTTVGVTSTSTSPLAALVVLL